MRIRKEMKHESKTVLKKHWFLLVLVCLLSFLLSSENNIPLLSNNSTETDTTEETDAIVPYGLAEEKQGIVDVINSIEKGNIEQGKDISEKLKAEEEMKDDGPRHAFGRSRGVLAMAINTVTSGSVYVMLFSGINSIVGSHNITVMIMVLLSMMLSFSLWYLVKNLYIVISRRIFLECRMYEKVGLQKFLFLFNTRKWFHAAFTMFLLCIYQTLWWLTLIGGIIKRYSYYLVPYIVAENPQIGGNEAIRLSRKMMKGHKWECFVCELSFLNWMIINIFTLGLLDILYLNPYRTAFFCEYYADIRKEAKEKKIPGAEKLNDRYLYEYADEELLKNAYPDVSSNITEEEPELVKKKGLFGFIARVFGVILYAGKAEKEYEEWEVRKMRSMAGKAAIEGRTYPKRLSPIRIADRNDKLDKKHYMRHYSVWSLTMLFFSFSMIGWIWEVSLHLISDGEFVNRGVLQGPWLPIYGTGGILILILLNKFREKPVIEFFSAIVLCGCVEYFMAYQLEMSHGGQKWWDYSGYFLNLDGRICAEGLLVFGLGGMMIVYIVAPVLDEWFKKINMKILVPICILLLLLYIADQAYSSKHPNTGKGVTTAMAEYSSCYSKI